MDARKPTDRYSAQEKQNKVSTVLNNFEQSGAWVLPNKSDIDSYQLKTKSKEDSYQLQAQPSSTSVLQIQPQARINKGQKGNTRTIIIGRSKEEYELISRIENAEEIKKVFEQTHLFKARGETTLGKGNYGKASLARRKSDNKLVVVKKVKKINPQQQDISDEAKLAELVHELDIKGVNGALDSQLTVDSNNNPAYYQFSEFANLGDGVQLAKLLNEIDVDSRNEILSFIGPSLVLTMHEMHQANIFHRDLKDSNLLANYDPDSKMLEVKLSDFGSTILYDSQNNRRLGEGAYDVRYAPAEITENYTDKEIDLALDIWRTGLTLLEMSSPEAKKFVTQHFFKSGVDWHLKEDYSVKLAYFASLHQHPEFRKILATLPEQYRTLISGLLHPEIDKRIAFFNEAVKQSQQLQATTPPPHAAFTKLFDQTVVAKRSMGGYTLALMPSQATKLKPRTLYIERGQDGQSIRYTVLKEKNGKTQHISGMFTTNDIFALKEILKKDPLPLNELYKCLPIMLEKTKDRGHTSEEQVRRVGLTFFDPQKNASDMQKDKFPKQTLLEAEKKDVAIETDSANLSTTPTKSRST